MEVKEKEIEKKIEKEETARLFFLIGIRRSGTSIMRKILLASPDVDTVLFEPHPLWHSIMMKHFKRFRGPEHNNRVNYFRSLGMKGNVAGAKVALNPGIDALDFFWIERVFPEAKFIIVHRDEEDTFQSYVNQDKNIKRGAIPRHIYSPIFNWLQGCLWYFVNCHKDKAVLVSFDKVVENPEKELAKVWKLLKVRPPKDLSSMVHKPKNWKTGETKGASLESVGSKGEKKEDKQEEMVADTNPSLVVKKQRMATSGMPKISSGRIRRPSSTIGKPAKKKT